MRLFLKNCIQCGQQFGGTLFDEKLFWWWKNLEGSRYRILVADDDKHIQVEESRSRHKGGTGLGLAISRQIVKAHGEDI